MIFFDKLELKKDYRGELGLAIYMAGFSKKSLIAILKKFKRKYILIH